MFTFRNRIVNDERNNILCKTGGKEDARNRRQTGIVNYIAGAETEAWRRHHDGNFHKLANVGFVLTRIVSEIIHGL